MSEAMRGVTKVITSQFNIEGYDGNEQANEPSRDAKNYDGV